MRLKSFSQRQLLYKIKKLNYINLMLSDTPIDVNKIREIC
jgi:hypothetical protein